MRIELGRIFVVSRRAMDLLSPFCIDVLNFAFSRVIGGVFIFTLLG